MFMAIFHIQVLLGLRDSHDEMVEATLHALGYLVPLMGADAVIGAERKSVFTDAKPRVSLLTIAHIHNM